MIQRLFNMKKNVFFTAFLLIALQGMCYSYIPLSSGGRLYWDFSSSYTTITIVAQNGSSWSTYPSYKPTGALVIPDSITFNGVTYPVTAIGNGAFNDCSGLTSVTIPNTVSSIGGGAFGNCSGLTSVIMGDSVTTIDDYAFIGCSSLSSISIPNSAVLIGEGLFSGCSSLTAPVYNSTCFICLPQSYAGNYTIPLGISIICGEAFNGCSNLLSVSIPNTVTTINGWAFYYCTSLNTVSIPPNVSYIGECAFYGCSSLNTVFMMPFMPPSLGTYAFGSNAPGRGFILSGCSYENYCQDPSWDYIWESYLPYLHDPYINILISVIPNDSVRGNAIIIPLRQYSVRCDSTAVIYANANYGYRFSHWSNGSIANPDTLHLTVDSSLIAYFEPEFYRIIGNSNDSVFGQVTGSDSAQYLDTVILVAHPFYGYHLDYWSYTSDDGSTSIQHGGDSLLLCANRDKSATAFFARNQYQLTLNVDTTVQGDVTGGGIYNYQSNCFILATPSYGYHFNHWSNGSTSNPDTICLTKDSTITAFFEKNRHDLFLNCNDTMMGTLSGAGNYPFGDTVLFIVHPKIHYHTYSILSSNYTYLDGNQYNYEWSGDCISDTLMIIMPDEDITINIEFRVDQHRVTLFASDDMAGAVTGDDLYDYGASAILIAAPREGYHFTQWSNGLTNNPYAITVTQDTTLTAFFAADGTQEIDATMESKILCYTHWGVLNIADAIGKEICVITVDGRIIKQLQCTENPMQIIGLSSGVYLIKIGDNYIHKIVITR